MKRIFQSILLAVLVSLMFLGSGTSAQTGKIDRSSPEWRSFTEQFLCYCGCSQSMFECNMGSADGCGVAQTFKNEVEQMMLSGKPNDEIKQYYLNVYGEKILMAPQKQGFSLTAWIMPFVALIAGLITVMYAVRRWVLSKNSAESETGRTETVDPLQAQIYDSVIDEERKKYM